MIHTPRSNARRASPPAAETAEHTNPNHNRTPRASGRRRRSRDVSVSTGERSANAGARSLRVHLAAFRRSAHRCGALQLRDPTLQLCVLQSQPGYLTPCISCLLSHRGQDHAKLVHALDQVTCVGLGMALLVHCEPQGREGGVKPLSGSGRGFDVRRVAGRGRGNQGGLTPADTLARTMGRTTCLLATGAVLFVGASNAAGASVDRLSAARFVDAATSFLEAASPREPAQRAAARTFVAEAQEGCPESLPSSWKTGNPAQQQLYEALFNEAALELALAELRRYDTPPIASPARSRV